MSGKSSGFVKENPRKFTRKTPKIRDTLWENPKSQNQKTIQENSCKNIYFNFPIFHFPLSPKNKKNSNKSTIDKNVKKVKLNEKFSQQYAE